MFNKPEWVRVSNNTVSYKKKTDPVINKKTGKPFRTNKVEENIATKKDDNSNKKKDDNKTKKVKSNNKKKKNTKNK